MALSPQQAVVQSTLDRLLDEHHPASASADDFLGAQFDLGLAWVHFPEGYGGLGVSPNLQGLVDERIAAAGGPLGAARNIVGYGMGGPVVVTHGTEEQKRRWLRPLFTGEEIWCQLFSEPGAGSDLASLATRAVRHGDDWLVTGQKVWTTLAHLARWGMLVARTEPDQPKHKGLTYFIVDMQAPGVEVRPLYQITGEAEFNEVFLTDVRVPDTHRIDGIGAGWRVALTTLMNERVAMGAAVPPRSLVGDAIALWREKAHNDASRKDKLVRLWCAAEVITLTNLRAAAGRQAEAPGPEGSIAKLASANLTKEITSFYVDLLGAEGMLYPRGYTFERPEHANQFTGPQQAFLRARANSIEGGTSEIMRNILAERVLGLPREPRTDNATPWSQIRRA